MASIDSIVLEVSDPEAARAFYAAAFDLDTQLVLRTSEAPTNGFRGYTLSLVVAQPSIVDSFMTTAVKAGATTLKPAAKSFWGYGGAVQAPDGAIWTIAASSKKDTGPDVRKIDDIVLLLGAADVKATKRFYVEQGVPVAKSFGSKYVELDTKNIRLALYGRRALAKNAGVYEEGSGSHRIAIVSDNGGFTDPDGFVWETASA